ncbi:MAG: HAMP domain-containing histidine kinase [Oscillospiraceae bacterium]|nr:HAMP domain-containing histidine kinase [Oscillospiraceae bacterium]
MTEILQKRFVKTAMTAITALIVLLLGIINAANVAASGRELRRNLEIISGTGPAGVPPEEDYIMTGGPDAEVGLFGGGAHEDARIPGAFKMERGDRDILLSSSYFKVRFDLEGNTVYTDTSHIGYVDEDTANELAEKVYASGKTEGRSDGYLYSVSETRDGRGTEVIFLDPSQNRISILRVVLLSCATGLLCWLLMLLLVRSLSKKAIKPIADNIEKQKQFVTNAGHELKTPLAIISANTEALELYNGESKWSRNIKAQAERLSGLVNNLLLLARMDESALKTKKEPISLSLIVSEFCDAYKEPMEQKSIGFEAGIAPEIGINADREQITQLISIMLDNSLKYTNEGGTSSVSLNKQDKNAVLVFSNTCEKLPSIPADKLFDRFSRGDDARTQKTGGYGIGLSVADSICRANGGSIECRYEDGNRIAFTVRFPAKNT